jgi:hypothetical protein
MKGNLMQAFKIKADYLHALLAFILAIIFFNPFDISRYVLLFLSMYIVLKGFKKKVLDTLFNNIQFWVLFLFCILYATVQFSYQFISIMDFINYLIYPLLLYIFGLVIITRIKNEKQIIYYLYAVILSFALFGILSVFYSIQVYGIVGGGLQMRVGIVPWAGDIELSSTGIGIYVCLGIALSGLMFIKTNIFLKALNALIFLPSLYSSIVLADRTGLVIAVLSVILIYSTQMRLNSIKNNIKIAFLFMVQCILLIFLFNKNVFNVKMMWLQSNAFERFTNEGLSNDPRYIAWGEAFKGLFTNPLGGKQAQLSLGYAHNLWLDVGWTTGLFPFILLVFFNLMALKDYIKLLRSDDLSLYFKYLITAMLCGFFITFMVEPIIEANVLFFCAFCFFSGILRSLNKRNNFVLKRLS